PEVGRLIIGESGGSSGGLRAFYQVTQSGYDLGLPTEPQSKRLEVFREFIGEGHKPVTQVKLGDEVEVHIRLRSLDKGELYNLALVDLLPGGFEVVIQPPESHGGDDEEDEKQDKEEDGSGDHGDSDHEEGDRSEGGDGEEGREGRDSDSKSASKSTPA